MLCPGGIRRALSLLLACAASAHAQQPVQGLVFDPVRCELVVDWPVDENGARVEESLLDGAGVRAVG